MAAALAVTAAGVVAGAEAARPSSASVLADHRAGPQRLWRVRGQLGGDPQRMLASWRVDLSVDAIFVDGVWEPWPVRVRTAVYDPISQPAWQSGDRFETFLRFRTDRPARNPLVSPRPPLRASGVDVRASLKSFRQLRRREGDRWGLPGLSATRAGVRRGIERRFDADGPLLRALLLGERGQVPTDTLDALARTGLIHLIAISGLHVGVVITALFGLMRLAGMARPLAALTCLTALPLLYGIVVPRPAVARACLMAALVFAGMASGRRTSALHGLVIATLALTLADPWAVRNTGFQLSTAATAAILLLSRTSDARLRLTRAVVGSLTISCAAGIAVAPVLAATTHRLPLTSVPLNLAAVPAMSIALVAAMASLTADAFGAGVLAAPLASLARSTLGALVRLAVMVDARTATLPVPETAVTWTLLTSLTLVAAACLWERMESTGRGRRRLSLGRTALVAACAIPLTGLAGSLRAAPTPAVESFRLVAFDIGQGDALLVETPDRALLVDTGGSPLSDFDPGVSILAPALRARGVHRLDGVAVTHLHADHAGGLGGLLREIPAAAVWVPSIKLEDPAGSRLLRDARATPVLSLASGQRHDEGPCAWNVLHPSSSVAAGRRRPSVEQRIAGIVADLRQALVAVDRGHRRGGGARLPPSGSTKNGRRAEIGPSRQRHLEHEPVS